MFCTMYFIVAELDGDVLAGMNVTDCFSDEHCECQYSSIHGVRDEVDIPESRDWDLHRMRIPAIKQLCKNMLKEMKEEYAVKRFKTLQILFVFEPVSQSPLQRQV